MSSIALFPKDLSLFEKTLCFQDRSLDLNPCAQTLFQYLSATDVNNWIKISKFVLTMIQNNELFLLTKISNLLDINIREVRDSKKMFLKSYCDTLFVMIKQINEDYLEKIDGVYKMSYPQKYDRLFYSYGNLIKMQMDFERNYPKEENSVKNELQAQIENRKNGFESCCFFKMTFENRDVNTLINCLKLGNIQQAVSILKDNPTFLNFKNEIGTTLFHFAALSGRIDVMKFMKQFLHENDFPISTYGVTVLHLAALSKSIELFEWLIKECHQDILAKTYYKVSVFGCACPTLPCQEYEELKIFIKLLLQNYKDEMVALEGENRIKENLMFYKFDDLIVKYFPRSQCIIL